MKIRIPVWDANGLVHLLQAAKQIREMCSIKNGGLPKFDRKWAALSDVEKRKLLDDMAWIAGIVEGFGSVRIQIEADVVEKSK